MFDMVCISCLRFESLRKIKIFNAALKWTGTRRKVLKFPDMQSEAIVKHKKSR